MTPDERRKKMKEDLKRRHRESIERTKQGQYGTIFLRDKIPEGITFWNCKGGKHVIDIIPYECGNDDPYAPPGTFQYVLDVWVHRNIGPRDLQFVCPSYTWDKPCPVCEDLSAGDYDDDYMQKFKAKNRTIYFIWNHDSPKEEKEGLMIWEIAHYFMQRNLDALSESPRGGGDIIFADEQEGRMIGFQRQGTGATNTSFLAHQFIERDGPIPKSILDQTFPLDEIVKMRPTYEEIERAYKGKQEGSPSEETPQEESVEREPVRRRPVRRESEPEQEQTTSASDDCPAGGKFGIDIDGLEDCQKCEVWDDCYKDYQRREKEQKQQEEEEEPPRRPRVRRKTEE